MNVNSLIAPHLNSLEFNIAEWLTAPIELQQSPAASESSVNQPLELEVSSTSSSDISQFRKLLGKVTYNIECTSDNQSFSSPMREMKEDVVSTVPVSKRPHWWFPEVEATEAEGSSLRNLWVKSPSKAWREHFNIPDFPDEEFKKAFQMSKTNFDMICKELEPVLEPAERRGPMLEEALVSLALAADNLRAKLLYLENRVGLAKLLFPIVAKVAMDIAQVDGTSEFPLDVIKNVANARMITVDLNEAPFKIAEEHMNRMRALAKNVELGKHYFPRCAGVLSKIMDADDPSGIAYMGNETLEECRLKKLRYMELQEVLIKAFREDKQEIEKNI